MPFKSEAQRRYFEANKSKLQKQGVDVEEWEQASKGMKLPERAPKKATKRRRFAPDFVLPNELLCSAVAVPNMRRDIPNGLYALVTNYLGTSSPLGMKPRFSLGRKDRFMAGHKSAQNASRKMNRVVDLRL
jgi:hypothetical protein